VPQRIVAIYLSPRGDHQCLYRAQSDKLFLGTNFPTCYHKHSFLHLHHQSGMENLLITQMCFSCL